MLLDPSCINLNTGSFGPLPRCVFEAAHALRAQVAAQPTDFYIRKVPELLWSARSCLAEYLNVPPARLLFTANVSSGINLVAASLRLATPGEILLSDYEYGAMIWCWERAAIRQGLTLRFVSLPPMPRTPAELTERIVAAITPRTRLLFLSHVISANGLVLPVREICREARRLGVVTVVDAAHATAMLPVDVTAIDADFYAGNCHKWLLAPCGSGYLAMHPASIDRVGPLHVSWGYHPPRRTRLDEPDGYGATPRLRALEFEGTREIVPWLTTPVAIAFQRRLGPDAIRRRIAELADYVRQRLSGLCGLRLATPTEPDLCGALTAFEVPGQVEPETLRQTLWQRYRIEMPVIERPERLLVRVSTHFYNTHAEIDALANALAECLPPLQWTKSAP